MGVTLYRLLDRVRRDLRIGDAMHAVGVLGGMSKVTELGQRRPVEIERVAALLASGHGDATVTPPVVLVADVTEIGPDLVRAHRVLGWNAGRMTTQDLDWDHLPPLGWAVTRDRVLTLYRQDGGTLKRVSADEATGLGILTADGSLAPQYEPTITRCLAVRTLFESHFEATCLLQDGRTVEVLGESEGDELPPTDWFAGRTTGEAAAYRMTDRLAFRR